MALLRVSGILREKQRKRIITLNDIVEKVRLTSRAASGVREEFVHGAFTHRQK